MKRESGASPERYSHCDGELSCSPGKVLPGVRPTGKLGREESGEPSQETCLCVESPVCCLQIDLPAGVHNLLCTILTGSAAAEMQPLLYFIQRKF